MRKITVKLVLYVYPCLQSLAEASEAAARNKAVLSYRSPRPAEESAAEVYEEMRCAGELYRLKARLEAALETLNEEERALVACKYFRKGEAPVTRDRSYYRKQEMSLEKVKRALEENGLTEEAFQNSFSGYGPFRRLARVLSCRRGGQGLYRMTSGVGVVSRRVFSPFQNERGHDEGAECHRADGDDL